VNEEAPFDADDEEWAEGVRWLREAHQRSRGYAPYWEWVPDRSMAELHAARVLHKFLVAAGKMVSGSLTSLTKLQADPPDVLLETVNGRRVGTEVTELLDPDAAKRHSYRKKRGDPPAYDSAPWTPTKMAKTLFGIIGVKDHKLRKVAGGFDECFLAIVTDEPGIDEWLSRDAVSRCWSTVQHIHRAFLVMSYHTATNVDVYPDQCLVLPLQLRGRQSRPGRA
jgi:hypothetical protein